MTTPPDDATPQQDAAPPLREHLDQLAAALFVARQRAHALTAQLDEVQRAHLAAQRAAGGLMSDDAEG